MAVRGWRRQDSRSRWEDSVDQPIFLPPSGENILTKEVRSFLLDKWMKLSEKRKRKGIKGGPLTGLLSFSFSSFSIRLQSHPQDFPAFKANTFTNRSSLHLHKYTYTCTFLYPLHHLPTTTLPPPINQNGLPSLIHHPPGFHPAQIYRLHCFAFLLYHPTDTYLLCFAARGC